jgi:hypothetical protein
MMHQRTTVHAETGSPSPEPSVSLTFFLTPSQRRRVLRQLRRITRDRARALCALVESRERDDPPGDGCGRGAGRAERRDSIIK